MEKYKGFKIEKNEWGYYEARRYNPDPDLFNKKIKMLKIEIDKLINDYPDEEI